MGERVASGQGIRVLDTQHPLPHRQQHSQQIPRPTSITSLPSPTGELVTNGQRVRVLDT